MCAPRPYWTPRWCVMRWREPWGSTFGFPPGRYLHGGVECPQECLGIPHLGSLQAAICTVVWNALKSVWEFHIWVPSRPLSARWCGMPSRESGSSTFGSLPSAICTVVGNALKGVWGFHIGFPYSFKENKNKIKSFSFFKDWFILHWFCSVVFFLFVFKDFILVKLRFSFWLVEV